MIYFVNKSIQVGRLLFQEGLVDAKAGNISVRIGDKILITRTKTHLNLLTPYDLILVDLSKEGPLDGRASSELLVHREIYKRTGHQAIVHAHPVSTIKLSFKKDSIEFADSEGKTLLGSVKVIPEYEPGSKELAHNVAQELRYSNLVVVRGHGVFSADQDLLKAYSNVSILEHSCKILQEVATVENSNAKGYNFD